MMAFQFDDAVCDASTLAQLLSVTYEVVSEMDYVLPDGRRNQRMDQLNALILTCERLANALTEAVDGLSRPKQEDHP